MRDKKEKHAYDKLQHELKMTIREIMMDRKKYRHQTIIYKNKENLTEEQRWNTVWSWKTPAAGMPAALSDASYRWRAGSARLHKQY